MRAGRLRRVASPALACLLLAAMELAASTRGSAQPSPQAVEAEEEIKRLIVQVQAVIAGATHVGAGIIFSAGADDAYVATANHVVRQGQREGQPIEIRFRSAPARAVTARLLPQRDDQLDLAVLAVGGLRALGVDLGALPFDRLGDPGLLQRGDAIFLLGHPNRLPWRINATAERFIERRDDVLDFESSAIATGHSGGALLDEDRRLVGMLKADQAPYGAAVSVAAIAAKLRAWGLPVRWRPPHLQVSAGDGRSCVLPPTGAARCWGRGSANVNEALPGIPGVRLKALSAGGYQVCGVAVNGAGYCAGGNKNGELGDGTTIDRYGAAALVRGGLTFTAIAAGLGHSCGLVADGSAYCWGHGSGGRLGNDSSDDSMVPVLVAGGHRFKAIAAGWQFSCGLTAAGAALCWGGIGGTGRARGGGDPPNAFVPVAMAPGETFRALSAGRQHTCGVTTSGKGLCWGDNSDGALGDGSNRSRSRPVPVAGGLAFRTISAGLGGHSCGVTTDGTGYCWGANGFGQLGDGGWTDRTVPVKVSGGLSFESISAGVLHTCGVTADDAVFCWGWNWTGGVTPRGAQEYAVPQRVAGIP